MKRILCYGDSNTFGHNPIDGSRLPRGQRWTGILADLLGDGYEILEEGLCSRTTVHECPDAEGMSGLPYLAPCLLSHRPVDLVILMLGTNDLQVPFSAIPLTVARGAEALVRKIRATLLPPEPQPQILLVSPILIGDVSVNPVFGPLFGFERAQEYSRRLAPYYEDIAQRWGCAFLDAAKAASPSPIDGLHMDPSEHEKLARAFAAKIRELLG